jgi:hypothetical protein
MVKLALTCGQSPDLAVSVVAVYSNTECRHKDYLANGQKQGDDLCRPTLPSSEPEFLKDFEMQLG